MSLIRTLTVIIGYDKAVLTKVTAEIWEHCVITTIKSKGTRNEWLDDQTGCKQTSMLDILSITLY